MAKETLEILIKAQNQAKSEIADMRKQIASLWNEIKVSNKEIKSSNEGLVSSFRNIRNVVAGAFITREVFQFGKSIIQLWWQLEQTQVAFTTMLWSAEEANRLLSDLSDFAQKTPFEITGIRDTAKQLMAMWIATNDLLPTLKSLWDVSAGLSVPLEQVAYAYWQVRSANQLYGTELRQFMNAWVPVLAELAKMYWVSEAAAKKMVEQGRVWFKDVEQAFKNMSWEWGKFFNLMDKQSWTLLGKRSNLQDSVTRLKEQIGIQLAPVVGDLVDELNNWLQVTFGTEDAQRKLAESVRSFWSEVSQVAPQVIWMVDALWKLFTWAMDVVNVFNTLDAAIQNVFGWDIAWFAWKWPAAPATLWLSVPFAPADMRSEIKKHFGVVEKEYSQAQSQINDIIAWWVGGWWWGWGWSIKDTTKDVLEATLKEHKDALDKIKDMRAEKMDWIKDNMHRAYDGINWLLDDHKSKIKSLKDELRWLVDSYGDLAAQTRQNVAQEVVSLQDQLQSLDKQIGDLIGWSWQGNYIELLNQKKELQRQLWLGTSNTTQTDINAARSVANESNIERILREANEQRQVIRDQIREKQDALRQEQDASASLNNFKIQLEKTYLQVFKQWVNEQLSLYDQLIAKAKSLNAARWGGWWIAGARAMWWPVSWWSPYLVGERWPELFVPKSSGQIVPNNQLWVSVSFGNVTINSWLDFNRFKSEVEKVVVKTVSNINLWVTW